jgi:hypothetical protein
MKYWIEVHFFYKIFEFLLIITGLIILIYIYFKKEKNHYLKIKKIELFYAFYLYQVLFFGSILFHNLDLDFLQ